MYVKPYYDARDGRLEQINVNKDIDALLLKNTQKDFESAVNIIEKKSGFCFSDDNVCAFCSCL